MTAYEFDVLLAGTLTDEDVDRLFESFGSAGATITPAVIGGEASVACYIESESMEEAVNDAVRLALDAGVTPRAVQFIPAIA